MLFSGTADHGRPRPVIGPESQCARVGWRKTFGILARGDVNRAARSDPVEGLAQRLPRRSLATVAVAPIGGCPRILMSHNLRSGEIREELERTGRLTSNPIVN